MSARCGTLLVFALLFAGCSSRVVIFEPSDAGEHEDAALGPDAGRERDADADRDVGAEPDGATDSGSTGPSLGVRSVAGFEHTCAATESGVACWGRNAHGELGSAWDQAFAPTPQAISTDDRYVQLCAAEVHTCGLRTDGVIACFGNNAHGQLGVGDRAPRLVPTPIDAPGNFLQLACGGELSCAVDDQHVVYCWGDNSEGALGQDDPYDAPDVLTPSRLASERSFEQVSVGQGHACAVDTDAELYCWGRNTQGQLGLRAGGPQLRVATPVDSVERFKRVAAGQMHTCAITLDGRLFCWGTGLDGRLGQGGDRTGEVVLPSQVSGASDYTEVQANWFHSCALRAGGGLFCWGRNFEGQLGVGDFVPRYAPTAVAGGGRYTAFGVGRFHSCGVRGGRLFCWGKNDEGQLGVIDPADRFIPNLVPLASAF